MAITLHLVEETDPELKEAHRVTDPKDIPEGTDFRVLQSFTVAPVDGKPHLFAALTWTFDDKTWDGLGIGDWIGYSGPLTPNMPAFIRDEFVDVNGQELIWSPLVHPSWEL